MCCNPKSLRLKQNKKRREIFHFTHNEYMEVQLFEFWGGDELFHNIQILTRAPVYDFAYPTNIVGSARNSA